MPRLGSPWTTPNLSVELTTGVAMGDQKEAKFTLCGMIARPALTGCFVAA